MRRLHFLGALGAALVAPGRSFARDTDVDPSVLSQRPALRVLLGRGVARPVSSQEFLFNGRAYRGSFTQLGDGQIVNLVDIESYLYSVVTREMPPSWPVAALQAQAICARSYVLQRSNPQRAYDVLPSEADQVYRGLISETAASRTAVMATTGDVLQLNGHFAAVAYSSCCGGRTESAGDAWGGHAPADLGGVTCGYCTDSPWYRWSRSIRLADLTSTFASELDAQVVQNLTIGGTDSSGRARTFSLKTAVGSQEIQASHLRLRLGTRVLPSLLVHSISQPQADGTVLIEGGGLGHGVGLCQWGARGLARAGASALTILSWYFPGTTTAHE